MGAQLFGAVARTGSGPPSRVVPDFVSNYQARSILIQDGLFELVDGFIKSLGTSSLAYQAWEYANLVYRNSEFIVNLGQELGMTQEQIDDLFIRAELIK